MLVCPSSPPTPNFSRMCGLTAGVPLKAHFSTILRHIATAEVQESNWLRAEPHWTISYTRNNHTLIYFLTLWHHSGTHSVWMTSLPLFSPHKSKSLGISVFVLCDAALFFFVLFLFNGGFTTFLKKKIKIVTFSSFCSSKNIKRWKH